MTNEEIVKKYLCCRPDYAYQVLNDVIALEELKQLVKENANNEFIGVRAKRLFGDK